MLEFTFEIIDEAKINIQYKYGSQFLILICSVLMENGSYIRLMAF